MAGGCPERRLESAFWTSEQAPEGARSGVEEGVVGVYGKHERTSTREVLDCGAIVETSAANVVDPERTRRETMRL